MAHIYAILNIEDGKYYIGSTISFETRWNEHLNDLRNGIHHNIYLQRAWNKYGEESFVFCIIDECTCKEIIQIEQYYLDEYMLKYNIAKSASAPMLGKKHSKKEVENMSKRMSGKLNPMYGKRHTDIAKKAMSANRKGKTMGSLNPMYGKKHSIETKNKISEKLKGTVLPEATKIKISESLKGRPQNPESVIKRHKSVVRIDPITFEEKEYLSIKSTKIDGFNPANVSNCCMGRYKMHKNYIWKHK